MLTHMKYALLSPQIVKKKSRKVKKRGRKKNRSDKIMKKYIKQNIYVWNIPRELEICLSSPILLRTIRLALHEDASGIATAEKI